MRLERQIALEAEGWWCWGAVSSEYARAVILWDERMIENALSDALLVTEKIRLAYLVRYYLISLLWIKLILLNCRCLS